MVLSTRVHDRQRPCGWLDRWRCAAALVIASYVCYSPAALYGAEDTGVTTAETLVEAALRAEIAGDAVLRATALDEAVKVAPDYRPARWQLGQIEIDGKWLPVEQAQQAAAFDPRLAEYDLLRTSYGDRPEGQLALARWCEKNGLEDEARFHWASVLALQPDHQEAQRALNVQWFNGRLLTREEIAQAKQEMRESQRGARRWDSRIAGWERALGGELAARTAALTEIRALDDPAAIPPLEQVTIGGDVSTDIRIARCRQLSMAFLDALATMPDHAAVESLVRHAVLAPLPSVRSAATDRLKGRPLHDFVPILLDGLATPIESWCRVATSADGSVHYSHTLYRKGQYADWTVDRVWSAWQHDLDGVITRITPDGAVVDLDRKVEPDVSVAHKQSAHAMKRGSQFGQTAQSVETQVARANRTASEMNARIIPVLTITTGYELGGDPNAWWDWWREHNEYYSYDETPTYEIRDYRSDHRYYRAPQVRVDYPRPPLSCFARGTPVWTKTGQRPIESLRLGDMVLSQNVDTGELAYKPVIGTTVRPPSPIVKLSVGKEQIATTVGHPIWVAGAGWQMAKELEDGAVVHGVREPIRVAAIESTDEAEAYNLIVADFNTYFVGKGGILVHDNTPRRPTRATVPGLASK